MLPVIGGLSVTPLCSSPPWPGNPIYTPLGRLKWQSGAKPSYQAAKAIGYAADSLVAFGQSGLTYDFSRQGRCSVSAKRSSPEINGTKFQYLRAAKMLIPPTKSNCQGRECKFH
jgi:hypothetical protein